jgi:hypothetical protein
MKDYRLSDGSEWTQDLVAFRTRERMRMRLDEGLRGPAWVPRVTVPRWTLYGEVYAYRTRKSHAVLGIPFLGWHWGYVGQTRNPKARHGEHMNGGGRYGKEAAAWSDLSPRRYRIFHMRRCPQWLLNFVEFLAIRFLCPVYNEKLNRGNPRRISRKRARRQRSMRMRLGWAPALHLGHIFLALVWLAIIVGVIA